MVLKYIQLTNERPTDRQLNSQIYRKKTRRNRKKTADRKKTGPGYGPWYGLKGRQILCVSAGDFDMKALEGSSLDERERKMLDELQ